MLNKQEAGYRGFNHQSVRMLYFFWEDLSWVNISSWVNDVTFSSLLDSSCRGMPNYQY